MEAPLVVERVELAEELAEEELAVGVVVPK